MPRLLILYDSFTGGTEALAHAAVEGAQAEADVRLLHARDATPDDLRAADGVLFACPENLAAMTGVMKAFFDRSYYPLLGQIEGRPYAMIICAGSEGENAARQMARILLGWRMKPIAKPLIICTYAQTTQAILAPKQIGAADLARARELGATLAAGVSLGIY